MDKKKIKEQKEMNKLLWEWCKVREKTHHDINYGSGDFYWEHMVGFGLWIKDKVKNNGLDNYNKECEGNKGVS